MSVKEEKRDKAKKLIEYALDDGVGPEERNAFAVRAIKLIRKYDLLTPPVLDGILENETVQAAKTVLDNVTNPDFLGSLKTIGREFQKVTAQARRRR